MRVLSFVAAVAASCNFAAALKLPTNDPFYDPPANLSSYEPGAVVRSRTVRTVLPKADNVKATFQYLYRTTDSLGGATAAVTTLIVPRGADPKKMLSYQFAYDACYINCSPSYFLQHGALKNMSDKSEFPAIELALSSGWYVNSPDYEGNKAAYVAGVLSGQATLDSVRAVLSQQKKNGLSKSARYALWGYSGGALAGEWAAELQPTYAPELHFVGAALGGLTPNISTVLLSVNKKEAAGLVPAGILGLAKEYPDLHDYIERELKASKAKEFKKALRQCFDQDAALYYKQDIFAYFKSGRGILKDPVPRRAVRAGGIMGLHGVPKMPLYVYKATHDEISPVEDTNRLVRKYCKQRGRIRYIKNTVGGHGVEGTNGAPGAFKWVAARLDGQKVKPECSTKVVSIG